MADIFISYAGEDRPWVEKFARALSDQGWSVWWDRSIPFGQSYQTVIEQALSDASCVFVVWSAHSIDSSWVWAEAEEARNRSILIPVVIDGSQPPLVFRQIQTADLSLWQIEPPAPLDAKLLRDLESLIGKPASLKSELTQPESTPQQTSSQPVEAEPTVSDSPQPSVVELGDDKRQPVPIDITTKQNKKGASAVHLVGVSALLFVILAIVFMMNNDQPTAPKIHEFSVQPQIIDVGDVATLSWHTESASKVELQGFGYLALSGSKSIRPEKTTIYTLLISNPEGLSIQREVELFVNVKAVENSNAETVNKLLLAATQAIKSRDFVKAEAFIKEAKSLAPESEAVLRVIDYFSSEGVKELLRLAREAINARDFTAAKGLLAQARESGADKASVQQTLDYYETSKTLYDQRIAAERRLKALKAAEEKAAVEAANKNAAADKWRLEQEAKSRQQAYELEQQQLAEIKEKEKEAAERREQEMSDVERLKIAEGENLSEQELKEKREEREKFLRRVLTIIRR